MNQQRYYRGGPRLVARTDEVKIDRVAGKLKASRGVSVYNRPDHPNLAAHGGAFLLGELPVELRFLQVGRDPSHHEIVPVHALTLTFQEYQQLLDRVELTRVEATAGGGDRGD
jgi:hypothetical protein